MVFIVVLIPIAFAGMKILQNYFELRHLENWDTLVSRDPSFGTPTLTVRGIIKDFKLDYTSVGFTTHHTFPAVVSLNITEFVWVDDGVCIGRNRSSIGIGYDFKNVPNFRVGEHWEASGYWFPVMESPYSNKLVVAPSINGSYMKPLP
jgi:hypothetical protein